MATKIKVIGKTQNGAALGVAKAYVEMNPATTLADLRKAFPNDIAPDKGVAEMFLPLADAEVYNAKADMSLYFTKDERPIHLQDGSIVAISQIWTGKSLQNLIKVAAKYNIEVEVNKEADVNFGKVGHALINVDTNEPVVPAKVNISKKDTAPTIKDTPKAVKENTTKNITKTAKESTAKDKEPKTTSSKATTEKPIEKKEAKKPATEIKFLGHGVYLINGHRFVDLGLPSKLLWAETNIGAENEYEAGNYFCWGETDPTPKEFYELPTYKYATLRGDITKYNDADKKQILDKEDDAAYVNWGSPCRMPTIEDFRELIDNCKRKRFEDSDGVVKGLQFISKNNGNSICFPQVGYKHIDKLVTPHDIYILPGYLWSSSKSSGGDKARTLEFEGSIQKFELPSHIVSDGIPVRPIAEI